MKGYLLPDPTTDRKVTLTGQGTPMGVAFQILGRQKKIKNTNENNENNI